jgi:hypothetical protein
MGGIMGIIEFACWNLILSLTIGGGIVWGIKAYLSHKRKPKPIQEPKFCKDCKHYVKSERTGNLGEDYSKCNRRGNVQIENKNYLVDGIKYLKTVNCVDWCEIERRYDCGKNSKYFEPKEEK